MGCSKITILLLGVYIQGASLVAQTVKNLPGMQETWVQSLGQEDPLEKEMATPREGNGNFLPGKFSCLENSMDRGAWQATVHGVTKSWPIRSLNLCDVVLSV